MRNSIVDAVMDDNDIAEESFSYCDIVEATTDELSCLQFLATRKVINNEYLCNLCGNPSSFMKYTQGVDKYWWQCSLCHQSKSVQVDSFYAKSHLPLKQLIDMSYMWCKNVSILCLCCKKIKYAKLQLKFGRSLLLVRQTSTSINSIL